MEIRVWQSYCSNNSTSYRLVARFDSPAVASDAAAELTAFFPKHAREIGAFMVDTDPLEGPTNAAIALAAKYGFVWQEPLIWGGDTLEGDEPNVLADKGVLVVYHTYCNGYPDGLTNYLEARGATSVDIEDGASPMISVVFRIPEGSNIGSELGAIFSVPGKELATPWSRNGQYGDSAFFSDGKTLGFHAPFEPEELPTMKAWLAERGVTDPSMQLCEYTDKNKFDAIQRASCPACHGKLEYLDPRVHAIEKEHLSCSACGAMYEVATFLS